MQDELVKNHMTSIPISMRKGETVAMALGLLQEKKFRHLPVIDNSDKVIGMVSDRDIRSIQVTLGVLEEGFQKALEQVPIEDIMSDNVQTIQPEDTLAVAASFMVDYHFNALPVVEGNDLVGIITSTDLMKAMLS